MICLPLVDGADVRGERHTCREPTDIAAINVVMRRIGRRDSG
jgi:hypothetical protein